MEFNYQVTHETADRTMTIKMDAGVIVFVDFKIEQVIASRHGEVRDKKTFSEIGPISEFERYLAKTAAEAEALTKIGMGGNED